MTSRARVRNVRRQTLGVVGLSAVASGTTALVLFLGSSQLPSGWLADSPFVGSSPGAHPLIVDSPAPAIARPVPSRRATDESRAVTALFTTPQATHPAGAAVKPVVAAPPPAQPSTPPKQPPVTHHPSLNGGDPPSTPGHKPHDSCGELIGFLGHVPSPQQRRVFRIWAVHNGSSAKDLCAVIHVVGFKKDFARLAKSHGAKHRVGHSALANSGHRHTRCTHDHTAAQIGTLSV
jgi:hypothetical protein